MKTNEKLASLIINNFMNMDKREYNRMMKWVKGLPSDIERYKKMKLRVCKKFSFSIMSKDIK